MGGHVFEPIKLNVLDSPADVDRLVHAPALVDVAHEVDFRADGLADKPGALHFALRRRIAGQRELHLHLPEAFFLKQRSGLDHMLQREGTHQRAARIGGNALAQPAEQCREGLAERFPLDVPKRHVDGGKGKREDSAGTGAGRRLVKLLTDGLATQRIFTENQRAELIDRVLQRRGERRAEESNADAFESGVRLDLQGDELPERPSERRSTGKRFIGGQPNDL